MAMPYTDRSLAVLSVPSRTCAYYPYAIRFKLKSISRFPLTISLGDMVSETPFLAGNLLSICLAFWAHPQTISLGIALYSTPAMSDLIRSFMVQFLRSATNTCSHAAYKMRIAG